MALMYTFHCFPTWGSGLVKWNDNIDKENSLFKIRKGFGNVPLFLKGFHKNVFDERTQISYLNVLL